MWPVLQRETFELGAEYICHPNLITTIPFRAGRPGELCLCSFPEHPRLMSILTLPYGSIGALNVTDAPVIVTQVTVSTFIEEF